MQIKAAVRAKGPRGFVERLGTISTRFGLTAGPMERKLLEFAALAADVGTAPTLAVTAVVLDRQPALLRMVAREGVEFAVHGLVHNDHTHMSAGQQRVAVARAAQLFAVNGIATTGFRAPYLRANAGTIEAVHQAGLRYDSSRAIAFDVLAADLPAEPAQRYARALAFYGAADAARVVSRPSLQGQVVVIPVSLPDDEIMVDRLHLDAEQQTRVWLAVLEATHLGGEIFTVQFHPERMADCRTALVQVLSSAQSKPRGVWTATLREVADWWLARASCSLRFRRSDDRIVVVEVEGDPRACLEVLGGRWPFPEPGGRRAVTLTGGPDPVVGVPPGRGQTDRADLLREEGFLVEEREDPETCAVLLSALDLDDPVVGDRGLLARVVGAAHPVVRLARWPEGRRSALSISGDVDSLTLGDFVRRSAETRAVLRTFAAKDEVAGPCEPDGTGASGKHPALPVRCHR